MVLVERDLGGRIRTGLMLALDLERYDYSAHSQSLIRATERTIVERIPPRMKIRRQAPLELPHIMVLIDDRRDAVLQAARKVVDRSHPLYLSLIHIWLLFRSYRPEGFRRTEAVSYTHLFEDAMNKAYLKARKSINIPGFRKGKAPRKVIENFYSEAVFYEDAFDLVFPKAYDDAIVETGIYPVDRPSVCLLYTSRGV